MPLETMEQLLSDTSEDEEYQRKDTRIIVGKKEYRITKEQIKEANEELRETAEKIFNATSAISQSELEEKVHNPEFMIDKLSAVLTNYLSMSEFILSDQFISECFSDMWTLYLTFTGILLSVFTLLYSFVANKKMNLNLLQNMLN